VPMLTFPLLNGTFMDTRSNLVALFPYQGGIFVRAGASCYGDCVDDFVMDYPGSFPICDAVYSQDLLDGCCHNLAVTPSAVKATDDERIPRCRRPALVFGGGGRANASTPRRARAPRGPHHRLSQHPRHLHAHKLLRVGRARRHRLLGQPGGLKMHDA
jgi:hypothetical protein